MSLRACISCLLALFTLGLLGLTGPASANSILVDKGVRAGGLWCFPSASDPNMFYYLPDRARIAKGANGQDIFSILFFADPEVMQEGTRANSTSRGAGGALLTLQLEYETPTARINAARNFLPEVTENNQAKLVGPIIYKQGRYQLITSLADVGSMPFASGAAPVLEGGRIAISAKLEADEAALLDLSLDTETPDLAVIFEMQFDGLHQAYDADLIVNWNEVQKSLNVGGSVKVYVVSAEVDVTVESLLKSNAVQLNIRGNDTAMDALMTTAHETVLRFLFEPAEEEGADLSATSGGSSELSNLASQAGGGLGQYFSLSAKYKRKDIRQSGVTKISMNKQGHAERFSPIVFDSGLLTEAINRSPDIVRYADLSETALRKRDVVVTLDASLRGELSNLISAVTVDLRPDGVSEASSTQQLVLTRGDLLSGTEHKLSYPRLNPDESTNWLDYEYRFNWAFSDGSTFVSPWQTSSAGAIVVASPYRERTVQFLGDLAALAEDGVVAVLITIEYDRLGTRQFQQIQLPTTSNPAMQVSLITANAPTEYDISVAHVRREGRESWSFADSSGFAVIDTPPVLPEEN